MKSPKTLASFFTGACLTLAIAAFTKTHKKDEGYIIEHEKQISKQEQGHMMAEALQQHFPSFPRCRICNLFFAKEF